jgi:anti-anti-sigma regulatory factor
MTWKRWTEPLSSEEVTARREQLVNILALGGIVGGLVYFLSLVVDYFFSWTIEPASVIGAGLCAGLGFVAYRLSRSGRVQASAIVIVAAAVFIGIYSVYIRGPLTISAVIMAPAIVFAGMAIGGRAAWITTGFELAAFVALAVLPEVGVDLPKMGELAHSSRSAISLTLVGLGILTLITVQTLEVMNRTLRQSQERESALRKADEEKGRLLEELQAREEAQRRLLNVVRELGSPIIPLAKGIIAMPLIGALDTERAQLFRRDLLRGVSEHRAHTVLVDITGVPVVDTMVAGVLIRAMTGVRLLGAEPVLTGIRSEVARTMVELGLDLSKITTRATLQEGLEYAVSRHSPSSRPSSGQ